MSNVIGFSLVVAVPIGLASAVTLGVFLLSPLGVVLGLLFGLALGLALSVPIQGGMAGIQYFTLRLALAVSGRTPWNYARFLDYAAERVLLHKVGRGYMFIHRLLQDHFAELEGI